MIRIQLRCASDYEHSAYGVTHHSVTLHRVTGKGIYNPAFDHEVTVWDNRSNPQGEGFIGPDGNVTSDATSVTLCARAKIIATEVTSVGDNATSRRGEVLAIGGRVALIHPDGSTFGEYVIQARAMADPILAPLL